MLALGVTVFMLFAPLERCYPLFICIIFGLCLTFPPASPLGEAEMCQGSLILNCPPLWGVDTAGLPFGPHLGDHLLVLQPWCVSSLRACVRAWFSEEDFHESS